MATTTTSTSSPSIQASLSSAATAVSTSPATTRLRTSSGVRTSLSIGSPRRVLPSLHELCKTGDLATFRKAIVRKSTEVFEVDAEGQTPLHIASYEGHLEMVQQLVFLNAQVDATDKRQWTPLHCAAAGGADNVSDAHLKIVAFLLDSGANPNALSLDETAPIHLLARYSPLDDSMVG